MILQQLLYPFLTALSLALIGTALLIGIAKRFQLVKVVSTERWHKQPKPHFGGIAIYLAYMVSTLLWGREQPHVGVMVIGATAIFGLGLLDDLLRLKPHFKLAVEIATASFVTMMGVTITIFQEPLLAMAATAFWIVLITNAFNLLDNMDGLSGGIAAISALCFLSISLLAGDGSLATSAVIIVGAMLGFLIFNFPPAKIFMGDCGALLTGYLLAVYTIQGSWQQASNLFLLLLTPVLLLGVPIFDTMVVSLQRLMHGRPITMGGKDHSSHRLVALGWNERQAILILYGLATLLGLLAVVSYAMNIFITTQIVLLMLVLLVALAIYLGDVKIYQKTKVDFNDDGTVVPKAAIRTFIPHKRRLLEIAVDSLLIVIAYIGAYLLRFEGEIAVYNWQLIQQSLPVIVPIKLMVMLATGLYSGVWKYVDFSEVKKIFVSLILASLVSICVVVGLYRFSGFSRSLFFIDFMMLNFLVIGFRMGLRFLREALYDYAKSGRQVLLVGAGEAGSWVLNHIRKDRDSDIVPVGIIDDDRWKHGRKLNGIRVLGGRRDIERIAKEKGVQEIILAVPSLSGVERQELLKLCQATGLPVRVLQGLTRWELVPLDPPAALPDDNDGSRNDNNNDPSSPYGQGSLH